MSEKPGSTCSSPLPTAAPDCAACLSEARRNGSCVTRRARCSWCRTELPARGWGQTGQLITNSPSVIDDCEWRRLIWVSHIRAHQRWLNQNNGAWRACSKYLKESRSAPISQGVLIRLVPLRKCTPQPLSGAKFAPTDKEHIAEK